MNILLVNPIRGFLDPSGSLTVHNWRQMRRAINHLVRMHTIYWTVTHRVEHPTPMELSRYDMGIIPEVKYMTEWEGQEWEAVCGSPWKEVLKWGKMVVADCLGHYDDLHLPPGKYIYMAELEEL